MDACDFPTLFSALLHKILGDNECGLPYSFMFCYREVADSRSVYVLGVVLGLARDIVECVYGGRVDKCPKLPCAGLNGSGCGGW